MFFSSHNSNDLFKAIKKKDLNLLNAAIKKAKKGDINAKQIIATGVQGTALHYAVDQGWKEGVEPLIESGADLNQQCNLGMTPLYWAVERKKSGIVSTLVRKGASCHLKRKKSGNTALHMAVKHRLFRSVQSIIENTDIDLNILNNQQETAIDCAIRAESIMIGGVWEIAVFILIAADKRNIGLKIKSDNREKFLQHAIEQNDRRYAISQTDSENYRKVLAILNGNTPRVNREGMAEGSSAQAKAESIAHQPAAASETESSVEGGDVFESDDSSESDSDESNSQRKQDKGKQPVVQEESDSDESSASSTLDISYALALSTSHLSEGEAIRDPSAARLAILNRSTPRVNRNGVAEGSSAQSKAGSILAYQSDEASETESSVEGSDVSESDDSPEGDSDESSSQRKQEKGKQPLDTIVQEESDSDESSEMFEIEARSSSVVCQCCFDEVQWEQAITCDTQHEEDEAHAFCFSCINNRADDQIGMNRYEMQCFSTSDCEGSFLTKNLLQALEPRKMEKLDQLKQQAEIAQANIEGLMSCPFCEFKAICYTPEFTCLNPACQQVSCASCKTVSHAQKTCQQAKLEKGGSARIQIEEESTAVIIRICPNEECKIKIMKEGGCNKITCTCGKGIVCDECGADITAAGYEHFFNGPCNIFDNTEARRENAIRAVEERVENRSGPHDASTRRARDNAPTAQPLPNQHQEVERQPPIEERPGDRLEGLDYNNGIEDRRDRWEALAEQIFPQNPEWRRIALEEFLQEDRRYQERRRAEALPRPRH